MTYIYEIFDVESDYSRGFFTSLEKAIEVFDSFNRLLSESLLLNKEIVREALKKQNTYSGTMFNSVLDKHRQFRIIKHDTNIYR